MDGEVAAVVDGAAGVLDWAADGFSPDGLVSVPPFSPAGVAPVPPFSPDGLVSVPPFSDSRAFFRAADG